MGPTLVQPFTHTSYFSTIVCQLVCVIFIVELGPDQPNPAHKRVDLLYGKGFTSCLQQVLDGVQLDVASAFRVKSSERSHEHMEVMALKLVLLLNQKVGDNLSKVHSGMLAE